MNRASIPALAALILLGACARVGADYHGPRSTIAAAPEANAPFVSTAKGPFDAQSVPGQWWHLYDDPVLDGLVTEALAANTDLGVARANIAHAQALVREAAAQGGIQTATSAGFGPGRLSSPISDMPVTVNASAGLSVSYELDFDGRLGRLMEASRADADAAQAAYDLTRITVAASVTAAYSDVCANAYQRAVAQRSLDLQLQSLGYTNRLVAAGRGTTLDRQRAQVLVSQLRSQIPVFDAARENALFRLAVLIGRPPADVPQQALACATPPRMRTALPVGDGASLLRRRPDVRIAERTVAAASARTGLATAELYPMIRLGGSFGLGGPVADLNTKSFSFSLGPLISWTFPNRTIAHAHIDEAEAIRQGALAHFDGTVLNALRETEAGLTTYAHELERNAALREARDSAKAAANSVRRLRAQGRQGALAVLDADRSLITAETSLAASDSLLASDQIAIFLALGGGWQDGPAKAAAGQ